MTLTKAGTRETLRKQWRRGSPLRMIAVLACASFVGVAARPSTSERPARATLAWSLVEQSPGLGPIRALDCPDGSSCTGADEFSIVLGGPGSPWTRAVEPSSAQNAYVEQIECPSAARCLAAPSPSGSVLVSSDGGARWHAARLPISNGYVAALSCPTARWCMAVGSAIWLSHDGGSSWQSVPFETPANSLLDAVSCSSSSRCLVGEVPGMQGATPLAGGVWRTLDGGRTFEQLSVPLPPIPGTSGLAGNPPPPVAALSCPSATVCLLAGELDSGAGVLRTGDFGETWRKVILPAGADTGPGGAIPELPDCVDATRCYLLAGEQLASTTDGGDSWSAHRLPSGLAGASALSCPEPGTCFVAAQLAASGAAVLARTLNGGAAWSLTLTTASSLSPAAVTCVPASAICVLAQPDGPALAVQAASGSVSTSVLAGGWHSVQTAYGLTRPSSPCAQPFCAPGPIEAASCPTAVCTMPSSKGLLVSTDGGLRWSAVASPPGDALVVAQGSCTSPSSCAAIGVDAKAFKEPPGSAGGYLVRFATTSDSGKSWRTRATSIPLGSPIVQKATGGTELWCWSSSACVVAEVVTTDTLPVSKGVLTGTGVALSVTSDGGNHWATTVLRGPILSALAARCANNGACTILAGGSLEQGPPSQWLLVSSATGRHWRSHELPSSLRLYDVPACAGDSCFAAAAQGGQPGLASSNDAGASWQFESAPASWGPLAAEGWSVASMSCATARTCIAVAAQRSGVLGVFRLVAT